MKSVHDRKELPARAGGQGASLSSSRETAARWIDGNFLALTVATAAIILYGSFYPFHFADRAGSPTRALWATWREHSSRGDTLGNVLLYMPLGFFAANLLRRRPRLDHVVAVITGSTALSLGIELGQYYCVSRVSSMTDVYANAAGAFLGSVCATAARRMVLASAASLARQQSFVLLLIGAWLAQRLFPFVPSIALQQFKDALKPLIFSPTVSPLAFYRHFVEALAVCALVASLTGIQRSRLFTPALLVAVICVRVTLAGVRLSPAEVLGEGGAAVCWAGLIFNLRFRIPLIAALMTALIVAQSLSPFVFLSAARPFGWIPFRSLMTGSLSVAILSFCEKVFMYGSISWLLVRSGLRLSVAAGLASGSVMVLRMCDTFIPGRSAEITDALMTLLLAGLMAVLEKRDRARAEIGPNDSAPALRRSLVGTSSSTELR